MKLSALTAFVIGALCLILTLKQRQREIGAILTVAAGLMILAATAENAAEALSFIRESAESAGVSGEAKTLMKALGIALMTQITADICRDAGEGTLGGQVEMFGRMELVLLSLPLAARLLSLATELLR